jgi:invasion protein IalB
MRNFTIAALLALMVPLSAGAAPRETSGPKTLGRFDDWTAAITVEGGQNVCYAVTRASASSPALHGRGEVALTVAERAGGRDNVALQAGFTFAPNAEVTVQIDHTVLHFYTSQRAAFARNGAAAVAAFRAGRSVTARMTGPRAAAVVDTFSLRGFPQAYAAIEKACPK